MHRSEGKSIEPRVSGKFTRKGLGSLFVAEVAFYHCPRKVEGGRWKPIEKPTGCCFVRIVSRVTGTMRQFDAIWAFRYDGVLPADLEDYRVVDLSTGVRIPSERGRRPIAGEARKAMGTEMTNAIKEARTKGRLEHLSAQERAAVGKAARSTGAPLRAGRVVPRPTHLRPS